MTGNHQVVGVMPGMLKAPKLLVQVLGSDMTGELTGYDRLWQESDRLWKGMEGYDRIWEESDRVWQEMRG